MIEHIRERFERRHQAGLWPAYVHEHLLPRLFGFELMMAPYAVAHFKLGLELGQARHLMELQRARWSYTFQPGERLHIYLTNTLEDIEHVTPQLGPLAILSREANEATAIKKHRPVLVVLGNPPYSNFGRQNRNPFILGLLADYKRGLGEKKLNLDDDFIKFIRWAQWRIERTGQGIIGFITNNVYLDGLTHRRMRQSLLESFDEIYVLNLHGSAKKQETAPDGSKDENVFDITVGVAIVLMVKLPAPAPGPRAAGRSRKPLATVHRADLWGLRQHKYDWLNRHNATNTEWTVFTPDPPDFFFHPRNAQHEQEWNEAWSLKDAFPVSNNGLKTDRDDLFFDCDRKALERRMQTFFGPQPPPAFLRQYRVEDTSSYDIESRRQKCRWNSKAIQRCLYRPFDFRWLYYDPGLTSRPAEKVMRHLLAGENLGLVTTRQTKEEFGVLATTVIAGHKSCAAYDINTVFPLYLYPNGEEAAQAELVPVENGRRPNLAAAFIATFEARLKLTFVADGRGDLKKIFGPEDVFHYIYAVLHAPGYRARYAEFLKLDFPRVPITRHLALFRKLCARGERLVGLHTLKLTVEEDVAFDVPGSNVVEQVVYVPPCAATATRRRGRKPAAPETSPLPAPKGYEAGPAGAGVHQPRAVFRRRGAGGVAVPYRRLPGGREMAQGPARAHADPRRHRALPADPGRAGRDACGDGAH